MAGSLVLWHSLLPHGPAPNRGGQPRVSAYVAMLPVDAGPYLGGRPADTPLSMTDAGADLIPGRSTAPHSRPHAPLKRAELQIALLPCCLGVR